MRSQQLALRLRQHDEVLIELTTPLLVYSREKRKGTEVKEGR